MCCKLTFSRCYLLGDGCMAGDPGVSSIGGALRAGPVGTSAPPAPRAGPTWPFPKPDVGSPPPLPAPLRLYPAPPLALAEPVIAYLQRCVRLYAETGRVARLAWLRHRTGRQLPAPDTGFWPLFWVTPNRDHLCTGVERRF